LSEGIDIQLLLLLSDFGLVQYWRGTAGNELEDSSVTIRYKGVCAPYFGLSKISDFGYALTKLRAWIACKMGSREIIVIAIVDQAGFEPSNSPSNFSRVYCLFILIPIGDYLLESR
jgi:hypothetical protein